MDSNHRQEAYLSRVLSFCHLAYRSFHPAFSTLLSFFSLEESTRSLYAMLNFSKPYGFVVGPSGLEPPTSCLSGTRSNLLSYDPSSRLVSVLFSLPFGSVVGSSGLEPPTSCLSGTRSNHLSYEPIMFKVKALLSAFLLPISLIS